MGDRGSDPAAQGQRPGRVQIKHTLRLGVLISGRGSNMEAIANAIDREKLDAEIAIVISNRTSAAGIEIARSRALPVRVLASAGLEREDYDGRVIEELQTHEVDMVCLAGFMRLLSAKFVRAYPDKILNIHPSLLPAFPGLDAQRQALEHGVKITGCTVHFVDEFLDSGPIMLQSAVPVLDNDTVDTLSARILAQEHQIYPQALQAIAEGRVRIEGRRVVVADSKART